jgi:hypothetical protein
VLERFIVGKARLYLEAGLLAHRVDSRQVLGIEHRHLELRRRPSERDDAVRARDRLGDERKHLERYLLVLQVHERNAEHVCLDAAERVRRERAGGNEDVADGLLALLRFRSAASTSLRGTSPESRMNVFSSLSETCIARYVIKYNAPMRRIGALHEPGGKPSERLRLHHARRVTTAPDDGPCIEAILRSVAWNSPGSRRVPLRRNAVTGSPRRGSASEMAAEPHRVCMATISRAPMHYAYPSKSGWIDAIPIYGMF